MGRSTITYKRQDGHPPSLFSNLSAFVRRILHIPMADHEPTLTSLLNVLQGAAMDEAELQKVLNIAYDSAAYHHGLSPDRARICKLRFMKEKDGLQHEYIAAYVTVDGQRWDDPGARRLGVILCERNVAPENDGNLQHLAAAVSNPKSSGVSVSSTLSASSRVVIPAADRVMIHDPNNVSALETKPGHYCVYEHLFDVPKPPPKYPLDPTDIPVLDFAPPESCSLRARNDASPPSLYDLAAAVSAIHRSAPEYTLLRNQCYWFAAMLYYTLGGERAANDEPSAGIPPDAAVIIPTDNLDRPTRKVPVAGKFHNLWTAVTTKDVKTLYDRVVRDLFDEELQKLYKSLRKTVWDALEQARTNEENSRALAENSRALAETSRALAETSRALAESQRANEEKDRIIAALRATQLQDASGQAGPSGIAQV
ncbi:hypothetical protein FKP32DRAFT_1593663 [Trametes sanguinea]|nr:hypothetical protein FKP32DRAFT_1593663 [Trametes sanguinea]